VEQLRLLHCQLHIRLGLWFFHGVRFAIFRKRAPLRPYTGLSYRIRRLTSFRRLGAKLLTSATPIAESRVHAFITNSIASFEALVHGLSVFFSFRTCRIAWSTRSRFSSGNFAMHSGTVGLVGQKPSYVRNHATNAPCCSEA
jgi:hypothetical protein